MDIRKPSTLKQAARQQLDGAAGNPRMVVLLHTAVALGAGLLITVLDFILTRSIDTTGGLAGLQTRSILVTAQSVLQMATSVLLPFWQIGLLRAAIAFARRAQAQPDTLLEGFRRFRPVLRLMLLRLFVITGILLFCTYAATAIFLATPFAQPMIDQLTPMLSDPTNLPDEATISAITDTVMLPLIPIVMLLWAVLALPILYRLRMSDYLIMDEPRCGARMAFGNSLKLTKRNGFSLFRIDLSFWWFYLLQLVCTTVAYADVLLPELGIALPIAGDSAFFVFYILSLFLQLVLYWRFGAYVQTTNALAYEILRAAQPQPEPEAKNLPWSY